MRENMARVLGILKEHDGHVMPSDINKTYRDDFIVAEGTRMHDEANASSLLHQQQGIEMVLAADLAEWVYESDVKTLVLTDEGREAVGL